MWATSRNKGFTIVELLIVIVVIGILAAITIVAYSGITNQAKAAAMKADLTQWKTKAEVYKADHNISCPDNYSFVYGNPTLGTNDFCVMKYEAKIQGNDNGTTAYNSSMVAESRASGTPWVNITQANASAEAQALGSGYHLLTESERMAIAADVLSVKYNWSGGEVGSGIIYQGHVNSNPAAALASSSDDFDALNGITGGIGITSGTNSSRVLWLSSGDAIWDFSGNVWEWTTVQAMSQVGVSGDSGFNSRQWNLGSLSMGNLPANSRPSVLAAIPALGAIGSWTTTQGIGHIEANYADTATRPFMRGGGWVSASTSGVLALSLSANTASATVSVGFRAAR